MKTILLLGGSGRLGTAFRRILKQKTILAPDQKELSLLDPAAIRSFIIEHRPNLVINATGYNAVDAAETSPGKELAFALNATAPANLANICHDISIPLFHFSTDYVFAGDQTVYTEEDAPRPINVYGLSKYEGEKAVRSLHPTGGYIFRVSRLFGPAADSPHAKKSFIDLILADAKKIT
jgi:dTDP-4-dehydrorhamnose reductase